MGTRGTVGFRVGGKDKLMYNHFDSYPTGLGVSVLEFIQGCTDEEIKAIAKSTVLVDGDVPPTASQKKICRDAGMVDLNVSNQSEDDWYCLLRNAQGGDLSYLKKVPFMLDANGFIYDSLFCEWGYIINVDKNVLEIYEGFNKTKKGRKYGRYTKVPVEYQDSDRNHAYIGSALIKTISLKEVREITDIDKWCSAFSEWVEEINNVEKAA